MAVARAQIRGLTKRMFSGISTTLHAPPHFVSSPQITDDKFSFMDAISINEPLCPPSFENRVHVFIKSSYLKGATQEEKMNFYVKTVAQVFGSDEEEAKERIYKITRDCSLDGFGLEFNALYGYKIAELDSVERVTSTCAGTVFKSEERIRWSLVPKRREIEKGRFEIPKPDLDLSDSGYDGDRMSESDYD